MERKEWTLAGVAMCTGMFALGAGFVAGHFSQDDDESQPPVVVTDERNVIVDMPHGVRWDIRMDSGQVVKVMIDRCEGMGGELIHYNSGTNVCEEVDF